MAENRSIVRDIFVGLVTGALSFGGAWLLQERGRAADLKQEQQAALVMLEQQKAEHERELSAARTLRAESNTMALYGEWQSPDVVARTKLAAAAITRVGPSGYVGLMANPSVAEREKDALNETLRLFRRARDLGDAKELDVAKARNLFGPAARWWSATAMPKLVAGGSELPGELINAAYGLAVLGGDVEPLAPPLDLDAVGYYVGLGPKGSGVSGAAATSTVRRPSGPVVLDPFSPAPAASPRMAPPVMPPPRLPPPPAARSGG
jgi:hypothetical protein